MKPLFLLTFIFLNLSFVDAQDKHTAPLTTIIEKIAKSWQDVDAGNKTGITLESVSASFSISKTASVGGEVKIWIFKLGRKVEKNRVHKITIELSKGDEKKRIIKADDSAEELTRFINAALADFKKLNDEGMLQDLKKRTITIDVGLTITNSKSVSGEYEIGIFSLSAEAGKNAEQGNTLTLTFSKN